MIVIALHIRQIWTIDDFKFDKFVLATIKSLKINAIRNLEIDQLVVTTRNEL